MREFLVPAFVSAVVSVSVCIGFSAARRELPVRWTYDEARAEKKRRDAAEAERQRAAAEFARTNKPVTITGDPITISDSGVMFWTGATMTNIVWNTGASITFSDWSDSWLPTFDEHSIELGYRLDGVVVFRTPPEAPRPKLTNDIPIL